MQGKLVQDSASFRRQKNERTAVICRRSRPADYSASLQPVDQTNGAVVPEQKTLREIANAGWFRLHRLDRQHQLVLLWFHSRAPGRLFAEVQELADLMTKLSQGAKLLLRDLHPIYIVTRYVGQGRLRSARPCRMVQRPLAKDSLR